MGVTIAVLLANVGVLSNLMLLQNSQPHVSNPFNILPEGTLWQVFFFSCGLVHFHH